MNFASSYKSQLIFAIVVVETGAIMAQACSLCVLAAAGSGRNQFGGCFLFPHTVKCAECL